MAEEDIFKKITSEYPSLTSAEQKIADYVLVNQSKTQYLSISELAEVCKVGEATITRFCKHLGCNRYSAFKLAVATATANRDTQNPLAGEVLVDDSVYDMCQKVFSANVDAISQTLSLIRPDYITEVAEILLSAKQVLCMGQGGSMILAHEAAHLFSTGFQGFTAVWDSHLQLMAISQLAENDAVIYFSYSGATKDLVDALDVIQKRGAKSILITHFPKSPGAAYADIVLRCGAPEGPYQLGSIGARMAQLFLVDVLFSEMCRRDMTKCKAYREQVANALSEKHY